MRGRGPLAMANLFGDLTPGIRVRERIAKLAEAGTVDCGYPLGKRMSGLPVDLAGELCSLGQAAPACRARLAYAQDGYAESGACVAAASSQAIGQPALIAERAE